jgi:predicted N-formylglutamate amidohydrolase
LSFHIGRVILSCEHGSTAVPREFAHLFRGRGKLLESHRGHDRGALSLARALARAVDAPLTVAPYTRLLVDPNRTLRRRDLFSSITRGLDPATKRDILARYFEPHRTSVLAQMQSAVRRKGVVLHLGVHTFAAVVRGVRRQSDVSLLYDPACANELAFCHAWRRHLNAVEPSWRVRRNYPFLGKNEGLTTWLRGHFSDRKYLGIEIELNDRLHRNGSWQRTCRKVVTSLENALSDF